MNTTIKVRTLFYIGLAIVVLWFLFIIRQILGPFLIAMIFAYIFNPLINFFHRHLRIPRSLSIVVVYVILISTSIFVGSLLTHAIISEVSNIGRSVNSFILYLQGDTKILPAWIMPYLEEYLDYFSKNQFFGTITSIPFPFVSKAFFGILNFFVFLFSAFFFLKDGKRMADTLLLLVAPENRGEASLLIRKINKTFSSYLRGQMVLILSMVVMIYAGLSILGVHYALTIALSAAILEIVPFVGPIIAAILSAFFIIISGGVSNFPLNGMQAVLAVLLIVFVARQIQDYLIAPYVIGKATRLHPLFILFSVLAGEHIYGILGVLLAVPVAAVIKILLEYSFQKLNKS